MMPPVSSSTTPKRDALFAIWIGIGLYLLLTGLYLLPYRGAYKTAVYGFLVFPSLIALCLAGKERLKNYFNPPLLLFCLYLFYLPITAQWGQPDDSSDLLKKSLAIIVAGYGIHFLRNFDNALFNFVVYAALIITAAMGTFWLIDFYGFRDLPIGSRFLTGGQDSLHWYQPGMYGGFYNPLLMSHTITFLLTLGVLLLLSKSLRGRALQNSTLVALVALLMLLLAAQTRMAWLLTLTIAGTIVLLLGSKRNWLVAMAALAVLALVFFNLDHEVLKRGFSYRPEIWAKTLAMMPDHWLLGHGMGAYFGVTVNNGQLALWDTHNVYLEILYYGGLVGVVLYLSPVALMVMRLLRTRALSLPFVVWLVYFGLCGMTDGGGIIARPNEHWFKIVLPLLFLIHEYRRCIEEHHRRAAPDKNI